METLVNGIHVLVHPLCATADSMVEGHTDVPQIEGEIQALSGAYRDYIISELRDPKKILAIIGNANSLAGYNSDWRAGNRWTYFCENVLANYPNQAQVFHWGMNATMGYRIGNDDSSIGVIIGTFIERGYRFNSGIIPLNVWGEGIGECVPAVANQLNLNISGLSHASRFPVRIIRRMTDEAILYGSCSQSSIAYATSIAPGVEIL